MQHVRTHWRGHWRRFGTLCTALMALNACQDVPTAFAPASHAVPTQATLTSSAGNYLGQVPYYCLEGRRSIENGWQIRLDTMYFPRADQDQGGRRVRILYWRSDLRGTLVAAADCSVPYTEAALRRVDRHLRIKANGAAEQFRAREEVTTVQGCVTDGPYCPLDPLVVVAPPQEEDPLPPCDACNYYPGGNGDGGGSGESLPGDTDGDEDTLDEGPGAFAACVAVGIGIDGWIAIGGSAYAGLKLFDARSAVRSRYHEYRSYAESSGWHGGYSATELSLLYRNYLDAIAAEEAMWVMLATSGGVAAGKIGNAVKTCAPLLAAPAP